MTCCTPSFASDSHKRMTSLAIGHPFVVSHIPGWKANGKRTAPKGERFASLKFLQLLYAWGLRKHNNAL